MSKYAIKKKQENILSEESATEQLVDLLSYYDIDIEAISNQNEGVADALERACDTIRDAIMAGKIEITRDDTGSINVKQYINGSEKPLVYREMNAKAKIAMDKYKENENYRRMYGLMGSLCGLGEAAIQKLKVKDLAVVEALAAVFVNA